MLERKKYPIRGNKQKKKHLRTFGEEGFKELNIAKK